MAALTKERVSAVRAVTRDQRPMAAAVKLFKGGLVAATAGFYGPAAAGTGKRIVGRAAQTVDNSAGAAGALNCDIHFFYERDLFLLANSGTNPVTAAMRELICYAEDDQTVGSLATGFSQCGIIYDVTTEGVWVEIGQKA
jgi:hypothetical protein